MFLNTYMMKESYRISTFLSSQELCFLLTVVQGFANFILNLSELSISSY